MNWLLALLLFVATLTLIYQRRPLLVVTAMTAAFTALCIWLEAAMLLIVITSISTVLLAVLSSKPLRRQLFSDRLFAVFRSLLPGISATERQALDAGTVWWDAELFSGRPNWKVLLDAPKPHLSEREQAFLDGPVEQLCAMLDEWQVSEKNKDLPGKAWEFIRRERFFSMIIPQEFGGLGFSAQANSAVVVKLASHNVTAAVTVMVPNSLGPGELLMEYGTEAQKKHYLPRLADGREIPCFGLTSPAAGSDAAAMVDSGIVCKGEFEGEQVLGLKLNWNKRYITLAPVATLVGLAFKAYDPDGLLGDEKDLGITCALIPVDTPGVSNGNRHLPVGSAFMNGPTRGKDVFIPMSYIIGGQERIGQGWTMLMQSLAAGRAISLPGLGVAGAKMMSRTTGAYARIRRQFNIPIGYFEGIEEPLARIAGNTYRMDAARKLTTVALDMGEKPSVLSALLKYQLTEGNRACTNDAMDVHAGKGIIMGPNNYLSHAYMAVPIAITVEGANILTRCMIVFGQGVIRCHPWLLQEMESASMADKKAAAKQFDRALFGHIGYTMSNMLRSLFLGLSNGALSKAPVNGKLAHYYRRINHLSAAFCFINDIVLLVFGGKFKFKEKISGRLADVLSHLYMASAVLKHFEDSGAPEEDLPLARWALRDSLFTIQERLVGVTRHLRNPLLIYGTRFIAFPRGRQYDPPSDYLGKRVARILLTDTPSRDRLLSGTYESGKDDAVGLLNKAFKATLEVADLEKQLRARFKQVVSPYNCQELTAKGMEVGLLTEDQATRICQAQALALQVINVNEFEWPPEQGECFAAEPVPLEQNQ